MSKQRLLVLVDGSSYLFRAYHALPKFTNQAGEPTGAIYGVVNMLKKLRVDYPSEYLGVIFDARGKTFRDEMYAEYKANRPPMPEDLSPQIEPLHEVVKALGMPLLVVPGVEADDVIGTLATQARDAGFKVVISTGDKDIAQLVDENVTLVNTMDDKTLDPAGVQEKFGVPPELIVDYLTLIGDTVDNVPGVPKVGPKTAAKWLVQYGSLDAIIENAHEVKGKVGENLRAALDQLPLSRDLVTLRCDVELEHAPDALTMGEPDLPKLKEFFARFEFNTWLSEATAADVPEPVEAHYEVVLDENHYDQWLQRLREADAFAFDTETTSLEYVDAVVVGISFAIEPGHAAYVPCGHDYPGAPTQLSREVVLGKIKDLLEDPDHPKIGQNLKYDMSVLANHGITLRGVRYDTMLESYVLDSTATRHDMDSLALKFLRRKTIHFEDIAGKGAKQLTFNQIALDEAAPYAAEDADVTLQLHQHLWKNLAGDEPLERLFNELEMPLVEVLSAVERNGVRVDVDMLKAQSRELAQRLKTLESEAHELAGGPFNLGSPRQIQEILYDKQGLPVLAKTPKGQPSTAESVLQELAENYELPRVILEHRALAKLRSTYTDALPACVNERTGRVHTSYRQAVASTGRLSSSEPNLQNIPIRTPEGRKIRQAFVAPPGTVLLAADYSQIELRIMAHLSQDAGLCSAFANGQDIHRATAAEVFGLAPDDVTGEQRRRAKAINFGLIYGMSAFGLGKQLGIDRAEAQDYVDRYFERYPGVRTYMEQTKESARERGFVETVFGRRLHLPEIKARNFQRRSYAERTAINAPMQGTAADIIKRAMIKLHRRVPTDAGTQMIMQVHDELVFEVAEAELESLKSMVVEEMTQAAELSVPLVVDVGVGSNWDEAH
ncbi:MAG: DNA polymerase I [Gammaproteobacteria bacterium]|nr:DNA polymerase I [Gammaproteobacteria bacterium]